MSKDSKISSEVSKRYAIALLDLASESKLIDKVEADVAALLQMLCDSNDLKTACLNPLVGRQTMESVWAELAKKASLQPLTLHFLFLLTRNSRLYGIEKILIAVQAELSKRRGEAIAEVQVAHDLTKTQIKNLQDSLSEQEGKTVSVQIRVNPDVLGGMIVTLGSRMIDDSVRGKLDRMRLLMETGANENVVQDISKAS